MKVSSLLLALLLISACGKKEKEQECDMVCEAGEFTLPLTGEGEVPPEALRFETNLSLLNFNTQQADKVHSAADLIKKVIASNEFKEAVLNHTYLGKKTFADNNGLTNLQIYHRVLIGAEQLYSAKNSIMDVELELYYENTSTIGYTYPSTPRIWMNTKFFNSYTPSQVSANLMHEWLHKLGFGHAVSSTPERPYTVPYAIGYMVRNLAQNFIQPQE